MEVTDQAFIYATWLKGLYHGNEMFRKVEQNLFYSKYHIVIEQLLANSDVIIACMEEEPDVVLGYCVFKTNRLHWVFVKKSWRKLGIAKSLVPSNIACISHITKLGESLIKQKGLKWSFDPFLF